ncbi:hypothetical protein GW17_00006412 [Ensete ventricosum]|nr:hypothetical protein GW17_00006412 [Ensete ventricosum]
MLAEYITRLLVQAGLLGVPVVPEDEGFFFSLLLNFLLQKAKRSWMSRLVANKKQEKEKEEKEKPGVEKLEEIADALLGTNPKQRRSRPHK